MRKGMEFFAHSSYSGDDPDIITLMDKYGDTGYFVFFRLLELMAQEFDCGNPAKNLFTIKFLETKLYRKFTIIKPILVSIGQTKRMDIMIDEKAGEVHLFCPKLKELATNYVKRVMAGTQWTSDKAKQQSTHVDQMANDLFNYYSLITEPKAWDRAEILNFVRRNKGNKDILAKARSAFGTAENTGKSAKDIMVTIEVKSEPTVCDKYGCSVTGDGKGGYMCVVCQEKCPVCKTVKKKGVKCPACIKEGV